MALTSESDTASRCRTPELRRAAVALAVVAAHVALIFVIGRSARHSAEVVEITLFPLPITPEDEWREHPHALPPISRTPGMRRRDLQRSEGDIPENGIAARPGSAGAPAAPIDWYAEARRSADALDQRERIERARRSLAGPSRRPLSPGPAKPPCPFEKCEPDWGTGFSIFESQSSKNGRIEKTPDGEVIRWISDRCYQILVTANIMHRGMTRCFAALDRKGPRGDLFKHMKEEPPPRERATDVP